MDERTGEVIVMAGKVYAFSKDLVKSAPVHYSNVLQVIGNSDGLGIIYGVKVDSLGQEMDSPDGIPHGCVFMGIAQAEALVQVLGQAVADMKVALTQIAEAKSNVA